MKIEQELLIPIIIFIVFFILNRYFQWQYANNFEKILGLLIVLYYSLIDIKYGVYFGIVYMIYLINSTRHTTVEMFENDSDDKHNEKITDKDITIIISRYNEDLKWTLEYPYNKYKYIVYNKGVNSNFEKTNVIDTIELPNVGRESHTYLHHIIKNYDNLNKINVFLPGSIDTTHTIFKKKLISTRLLNNIEKYNRAVFVSFDNVKNNNVVDEFKLFQVNSYSSTTRENYNLNNESKTEKCKYRPYFKWYYHVFGDKTCKNVIHYGIFSVDKNDILQYPKSYYENLINYVNKSSNPEAGHFFEKSWGVIFSPFKHTKIVYDNEIVDPFKNRYF
jgi:hypothetical protein